MLIPQGKFVNNTLSKRKCNKNDPLEIIALHYDAKGQIISEQNCAVLNFPQ